MIVEALKQEGVDTVFGYPGGAVIPIFDALYDAKEIRLILTRHEQAAVHAADGYARVTGKVGVCIATSGPGATNTVTGLATARFDSVPLVCITGQVSRAMIGNDAFQEADTVGITQPVTKHNYLVTKRENLAEIMRKSFFLAANGRPGPIVVDVPKDVQNETYEDTYPAQVMIRGYKPVGSPEPKALRALSAALAQSKKPLFFLGGGMVIANAEETFDKILQATGVPVITSLMGIGVVDSRHPLNLGMVGMHGSVAANKALTACDLLIGLGVRFDDRATGEPSRFAPHAVKVHVDIDPSSIGRNIDIDIPVIADLRLALDELLPLLPVSPESEKLEPWLSEIKCYKSLEQRLASSATQDATKGTKQSAPRESDNPPDPREVLDALNETFPDAVVSTEVGQNQMWAAQYLAFSKPRRWLTSGGLGTMGYGFPAGMGAQASDPHNPVIVVAGDGSFQMNIQELATCVQQSLPVIVVILNNGYLGMVRQWQELFYKRRYSSTCLESRDGCNRGCVDMEKQSLPYMPDFAGIAKAYGAQGYRTETLAQFKAALQAVKNCCYPTVIDCAIAKEANVWPMVAPGKGNDQMLYKNTSV
jgi:acetolactate synthase-1/2/3 large subunit